MTTRTARTTADPQSALRRALLLDALASGAAGLLLLVAAGPLDGMLGLPTALLRWAGAVLVPFAAGLVYLARRPHVSARAAWAVVVANVLWAVDSALLLATGWVAPTAFGTAFVLAQAALVAAFAVAEHAALRRSVAVAG
jgi:hypothetical protein